MIILDSNIISEFQKSRADEKVRNWFEKTPMSELATCSPVIMEMTYGSHLRFLRTGSDTLTRSLMKFTDDVVENRIYEFDFKAAQLCARLRAESVVKGLTKPVFDVMIASICMINGATLATRNTKNFQGLDLKLINPFDDRS